MNFSEIVSKIDFLSKLNWAEIESYLIHLLFSIILLNVAVFIVRVVLVAMIKQVSFIEEKKKRTFESAIVNTSHYLTFFLILIVALQPLVDLKQLLVAGGVIGIVIGFGAQSLIKDMLTGFFLLFEQQFQKGDYVHINEELEGGIVEEVGFRVVKIRMLSGKLVIIPNGEIKKVVNGNVLKRRINESVLVSFREEPKRMKEILEVICEELNSEHEEMLLRKEDGEFEEKYQVRGLSSLDSSPFGYRYSIVGTVNDVNYIEAVQKVKEKMAQTMYEKNVKVPEQQVYYKTRL